MAVLALLLAVSAVDFAAFAVDTAVLALALAVVAVDLAASAAVCAVAAFVLAVSAVDWALFAAVWAAAAFVLAVFAVDWALFAAVCAASAVSAAALIDAEKPLDVCCSVEMLPSALDTRVVRLPAVCSTVDTRVPSASVAATFDVMRSACTLI